MIVADTTGTLTAVIVFAVSMAPVVALMALAAIVYLIVRARMYRKVVLDEGEPPVRIPRRAADVLEVAAWVRRRPEAAAREGERGDATMDMLASASRVVSLRGAEEGFSSHETGRGPTRPVYQVVVFTKDRDFRDIMTSSDPALAEAYGRRLARDLGVPFEIE